MILVLLPVICWIYLALAFSKRGQCWRSSFLSSSVVWGVLSTLSAEVLSIFNLLILPWLAFFWGIAAALAALLYYFAADNSQKIDVVVPAFLRVLLGAVMSIVLTTGLVALVAPPNTWDSMTYHMSRVVHWIQNRSVDHYPTNIIRQLELTPWAEYAILHLQILSGQDYFANLIQWFSMVGCVLGVTLLAERLGADVRGQLFSAVTAVTIPMGILQASSTQNDYVVAFWLVCFVYFGMLVNERLTRTNVLIAGAGLGLAVLTKGTAYIYAFPFVCWIFLTGFKNHGWKIFLAVFVAVLVVLLLNIGFFKRNYELFGNPLRSGYFKVNNEVHTPRALLSNIMKNLGLHIGTPFNKINRELTSSIVFAHLLMHSDVNDPKISWDGTQFQVTKTSVHEDSAGNPLHLLAIMVVAVLLFWKKKLRHLPTMLPYVYAVTAAFLLFSFLLKWQPWASRLHLPLFVFWSPVVGTVLGSLKQRIIVHSVVIALLLASLPYLLYNESRPLVSNSHHRSILKASRLDQYFFNRPSIETSYLSSTALAQTGHCKNIGIITGVDDWEYPLWVLTKRVNEQAPRIEHIQVTNKSKDIPLVGFEPCLILQNDNEGSVHAVSRSAQLTKTN